MEATMATTEELREELAAREHEQWADWMRYFFEKCTAFDDGSLVAPSAYVAALRRQIDTPYAELSEAEKNADRVEADRVLLIIARWQP
jgi:hypothetical protein